MKKILLVDDEVASSEMLKLNLEATGAYEVRVINDPFEALEAVLEFKPDLVLLDVIMAHMEGPDVAIAIKENPEVKDTPIIFLTATVTHDEVDYQGGLIGGHHFVAKPTQIDILIKSIENEISSNNS